MAVRTFLNERWENNIRPHLQHPDLLDRILEFLTEATLTNRLTPAKGFIHQMLNNLTGDEVHLVEIGKNTTLILELEKWSITWAIPVLENPKLYLAPLIKQALQVPLDTNQHWGLRQSILIGHMHEEYYGILRVDEFIRLVIGREQQLSAAMVNYIVRLPNGGFTPAQLLQILSVVQSQALLMEIVSLLLPVGAPSYKTFATVTKRLLSESRGEHTFTSCQDSSVITSTTTKEIRGIAKVLE